MPRPCVLLTVYRRYWELSLALTRLRDLAGEFPSPPYIAVVWADPEYGRLTYFRDLLSSRLCHAVYGRPRVAEDGTGATTRPEGLNIRLGYDRLRWLFGRDFFCVVQAADVYPRPGAYKFVCDRLAGAPEPPPHWDPQRPVEEASPAKAVCFRWENPSAKNAFHTNFFGVASEPHYWPPTPEPDQQSVLEHLWGKTLSSLPDVYRSHNSGCRFFWHEHESEGLCAFPVEGEWLGGGVWCHLRAPVSWGERCRAVRAVLGRMIPSW